MQEMVQILKQETTLMLSDFSSRSTQIFIWQNVYAKEKHQKWFAHDKLGVCQ